MYLPFAGVQLKALYSIEIKMSTDFLRPPRSFHKNALMAFLRNEGTLALIAAGLWPALVGARPRITRLRVFLAKQSSVKNEVDLFFALRGEKSEAFPL